MTAKTFSFGVVCCRGCKASQIDVSCDDSEDRHSKRLDDVVCWRCKHAGTYWLWRGAAGLTKEEATRRADQHRRDTA